jgi:hypothetical protein
MRLRGVRIGMCVAAAAVVVGCGIGPGEPSDEKRYVKICSQYIGAKYDNAEELCRCQWKHIKAHVPKKDLDEFFFKMTAGRRFETKASKMIDRISRQCEEKIGAQPAD